MRACLEVDLQALSENIKILSGLAGESSFFCPMIKANSYGHGALVVAKKLQSIGLKNVGVISIEEALQIKSLSRKMEIYVFSSFDKKQIDLIDSYGFIPVVGQWEDLKNLAGSQKKEISFHIKFNLGMNRLGFQSSEVSVLIEYIKSYPCLNLTGLCSHLSEGETAGLGRNNWTTQQIGSFKKICCKFQNAFPDQDLQCHLLGSVGWLALWSHSKLDPILGFRPGICLYGIKSPVAFKSKAVKKKYNSLNLKNVSCLKSFVVQSRILSVGQSVSYGRTWIAKKKSVLAVVSMGYADGLPYRLSNKAEVLFRGKRVPIVGRVCMDFFMIDATAVVDEQEICKGEEVVIFGPQKNNFIPIEEQAEKAGSIPYELLTGLGNRVRRVFLFRFFI